MDLENYLLEYSDDLRIVETSFYGLKPGDLISFDYKDGSSRSGLVVRSKRTSSGYFLSSRNNTLLNIFLVESITSGMFDLMINNLYRNRLSCTYKNTPRILGIFLGKNNFRTFNVAGIQNIRQILINR
jgi:hypothetical protein